MSSHNFDLVRDLSSCHRAPLPASASAPLPSPVSVGRGGRVARWAALCCPCCGLDLVGGNDNICGECLSRALGDGPWNSCVGQGQGEGAGTTTTSASIVEGVGCPTLDNLSGSASLASYVRWAPEGVHVDSWECHTVIAEVKLSKTVLVAEGCEVTVPVLSVPDHFPKSPGQEKIFRNQLSWSTLLRTETSWVWVFGGHCGVSSLLLRLYRRLTGLIEALTEEHGR